ncbi:MAG: lycopene cyclase [Polyangiaceae bacterium]
MTARDGERGSDADALARVREAGGQELAERLLHLDAVRDAPRAQAPRPRAPDIGAEPDFDVVIAGGGLSLLYAPVLASHGLRVAVLERARAGAVHREWNASGPELQALVRAGLVSAAELEALIVARYRVGVCRWHGGGEYAVRGVLDHAVDAAALLEQARRLALARGVEIQDGTALEAVAEGAGGIALGVRASGVPRTLTARLLVDARGASSPWASADMVCPTVGGVVTGLAEGEGRDRMRRDVGEILATTEGIDDGRQHVWEAFPGACGETTVYLFHYARAGAVRRGELLQLYARFFARLPSYKRGQARLLRPTFGFIPGWSRLGPPPAPPSPRVVLVGDAAARHPPRTLCGFGPTLSSLAPAAAAMARAAQPGGDVSPAALACIVDDRPLHAVTGALAMVLASPSADPRRAGELNALLDAAFAALHAQGEEGFAALLRDEARPGDVIRPARHRNAAPARLPRRPGSPRRASTARWAAGWCAPRWAMVKCGRSALAALAGRDRHVACGVPARAATVPRARQLLGPRKSP